MESKPDTAEDFPFTATLPDGRTLFVLVPSRYCRTDRTGEVLFTPEGQRFLDRVQALASRVPPEPTPGLIRALREALGLTQAQLGEAVGVDKITVSRWERGATKPGKDSAAALERLRKQAGRRGVVFAA